jgi:hypothetical protein
MCSGAFVRLWRLRVPGEHRKKRYKRKNDQDLAANPVDPLCLHGAPPSFPLIIANKEEERLKPTVINADERRSNPKPLKRGGTEEAEKKPLPRIHGKPGLVNTDDTNQR